MRVSWSFAPLSCALVLSGCSTVPVFNSNSTTPASSAKHIAISGKVHGGQNPISGAHVYLYAVNNTGYAGPGITASGTNAAISELNSPGYVTTASDGTFSISGDYTCPTATPNLYLLAVGGSPGGVGSSNSAIVLAAGLGPCTAMGFTSLYVVVNEVSTVAAAYAAAGFATDPYHVSSSSSSLAVRGVEDALASIVNLETMNTGMANTTTSGGNGAVPQAEINTLANILAACVNSTGPTSMQCTTLFNNAENGSTPAPDTATAALNIAHNPGANIMNLFNLQSGSPPFIPDLTTQPNDFTMDVTYSGGGLNLPYTIAIDASDNVWVVSQAGALSKFDPLGVALSGVSGYTGTCIDSPHGLAIDSSANVWVANSSGISDICEYSSAGVPNNTPFTGGGLNNPYGIAIDGSGNMWVANFTGNSISEFNSSGTPVSSTGYTAGGIDSPFGIAVDATGNIWVANNLGTPSISELNSTGSPVGLTPFTGGGLDHPIGIAIDGAGNVWAANNFSLAISEFQSSGTAASGSSGDTGGGLDNPYGIAVDSNGNIWAVNETNNSISEFNSSGTAISPATTGYTGTLTGLNALANPYFLAIDGSGNVWVTNFGYETVTEFVGAATPVVTPIAANLQSPYAINESAVNRP